jgi:hypothetical protein
VYDDSCNAVDGLTTDENPCTQGIFSCSPPPILFTGYKNTFTGLQYACRTDPNSGNCGSDVISVCVRIPLYFNDRRTYKSLICSAATTATERGVLFCTRSQNQESMFEYLLHPCGLRTQTGSSLTHQ